MPRTEAQKLARRGERARRRQRDIDAWRLNRALKTRTYVPANACEICDRDIVGRKACRDHDHITGQKRGLLCLQCNTGLGMFKDNPLLLQEAASYLQRYKELEWLTT